MRPSERPSRPGALTRLTDGDIEVRGRLPWSSNGTFLVDVRLDGEASPAVYKPLQGERPLWDYPRGLYRREVAAYLVSEWLGWGLVPETVERDAGPLGPGSLQRFVDADFEEHYFTLLERAEHTDTLKAVCAFDLLVNNGDRKGGHCIVDRDGRIWGIDHGLSLHVEPKLRTVIWDFEGQPIPPGRAEDIARIALAADPPPALADLLSSEEMDALVARAARLVRRPVYPSIRSARAFPWPLI
ncbi:MAG: SCO1664 family protein [Acidimicrobiales bacterium]